MVPQDLAPSVTAASSTASLCPGDLPGGGRLRPETLCGPHHPGRAGRDIVMLEGMETRRRSICGSVH